MARLGTRPSGGQDRQRWTRRWGRWPASGRGGAANPSSAVPGSPGRWDRSGRAKAGEDYATAAALLRRAEAAQLATSCWNFTNDGFQDIGLPSTDIGRGEFLPNVIKMKHAFKTPGLREIARRGPFMHDGSLATLEAVIDHYDRGGVDRPSRSDLMKPLGLTSQEKTDLVVFLKTLTSNLSPTAVPILPR